MFTTIDKAIAALIAPIFSILVAVKALPEDFATTEIITGVTAVITALVVYFVPNKE